MQELLLGAILDSSSGAYFLHPLWIITISCQSDDNRLSPFSRAWVMPGEGSRAVDKANRRLHPDRRSRAGLPSRDRGRRTEGIEDLRDAVAEVQFVDAGRPEGW